MFGITVLKCSKRSFSNRAWRESTSALLRFLASAQHSAGREVEPRAAVRVPSFKLSLLAERSETKNIEVRSLFLCGALFNLQKLYL